MRARPDLLEREMLFVALARGGLIGSLGERTEAFSVLDWTAGASPAPGRHFLEHPKEVPRRRAFTFAHRERLGLFLEDGPRPLRDRQVAPSV